MAPPAKAQDPRGNETARPSYPDGLAVIVVTARRRPEMLQEVPVSVVSLDEDELDARAITHMRDLQRAVPNLTFAAQQNVGEGAGNIFIRGIGQEDFFAGAEPGVALYLDGVYVATTRGTMIDLEDVERIEVLRGPQGTLFGKNAIGGAIQFVSRSAGPGAEARTSVTVGSFGRRDARAMANHPLSGRLFARASVHAVRADGFMRRLPPPGDPEAFGPLDLRPEGAERRVAGRMQVRWLPDRATTVDLALDASRVRNTQSAHRLEVLDPASGSYPTYNRLIEKGALPGPLLSEELVPDDLYETYAGGANRSDLDGWGVSLTARRETGVGILSLIAARRGLDTHFATDGDGLAFEIGNTDFDDRHRQSSLELQLTGTKGRADYSIGLYGLWNDTRSVPTTGLRSNATLYLCGCFYDPEKRPRLLSPARDLAAASRAAYGQVTVALAPAVNATLGARWTRDTMDVRSATILVDGDTLEPTGLAIGKAHANDAWTALNYRAGLEWRVTDRLFVYGSLASGYKSGGFNVRAIPALPDLGLTSYDPETAISREIGLRSQWFDDRLRVNVTGFDASYRDLQLRQQKIIEGIITSQVDNAARARISGLEVEMEGRPLDRLRLHLALGLLDARYVDVTGVPDLTLDSAFQRTPANSWAAGLSYRHEVVGGRLEWSADYSHRSKEQFQIVASSIDQPGYGLATARVKWTSRSGRWSAALTGTNLANTPYSVAGRGTTTIVGHPRRVALRLERSW